MVTVLILKRKKEMQKSINTSTKTLASIAILFILFSCSKEDNLNNLNDTLFVRHKNADMPAYIHGNASERVFLIILHGGPGGFGLNHRRATIKSDIEKEYAVVYFDQRGSGISQGSYSEDDINIDIMAEDVLALAKVIKHKYGNDSKLFLMGHSWGGTLGPATLLKDQSDFLGWINVDGAHNPKNMYTSYIENFRRVALEQIEIGKNVPYWESIIDLINTVKPTYNLDDIGTLNSEAFEAEIKLRESRIINKEQSLDNRVVFKYNLLTLIRNMIKIQSILDESLFEKTNYTNRLSEITIPSLVLWGKYDMVVPVEFAQEAFDNLGANEKELVIFEKSGHSPMFSEPDLFAETVLAFINANK